MVFRLQMLQSSAPFPLVICRISVISIIAMRPNGADGLKGIWYNCRWLFAFPILFAWRTKVMWKRLSFALATVLAATSSAVADNLTVEATADGVKVDSAEFAAAATRFTYDQSSGVLAFYGGDKSAVFVVKATSLKVAGSEIKYSSHDGTLTTHSGRKQYRLPARDGTLTAPTDSLKELQR
jgi:hypothetical protein